MPLEMVACYFLLNYAIRENFANPMKGREESCYFLLNYARSTFRLVYQGASIEEIDAEEIERVTGVSINNILEEIDIIDGKSGLQPPERLTSLDKAYRVVTPKGTRIVMVFNDRGGGKVVVVFNPSTKTVHMMTRVE